MENEELQEEFQENCESGVEVVNAISVETLEFYKQVHQDLCDIKFILCVLIAIFLCCRIIRVKG